MLGVRYDSVTGRLVASQAIGAIRDAAYAASVELGGERGACWMKPAGVDNSRQRISPMRRGGPSTLTSPSRPAPLLTAMRMRPGISC
jgi:hypothetical protein